MRLTGQDHVYWTPKGNKLHLYDDCQHVRNSEVSEGTVKDAWEARKIDNNEVCKTCLNKAEKNIDTPFIPEADEDAEAESDEAA